MDYGVQFNKLMYERLIAGENITLFSPHDVRLTVRFTCRFKINPKNYMKRQNVKQA